MRYVCNDNEITNMKNYIFMFVEVVAHFEIISSESGSDARLISIYFHFILISVDPDGTDMSFSTELSNFVT